MKRPANAQNNLERVRAWRSICPDITIRSTFIVGFPGETESEFDELLSFLHEAELDRVGCFAYSPVDGAAANALPGAVPEELKEERRARFMAAQAAISSRRLAAKVGRTVKVIVDRIDGARALARSAADAPDIDGTVTIEDGAGLVAGSFARVTITGSSEHDLMARLAAAA
jgi:ribosomal protein S12 methylthiotransferase